MRGRWVLVIPAVATLACVQGEGPKETMPTYFMSAYAMDGDCPTDPGLDTPLWQVHEIVGSDDDPRLGRRVGVEGIGICALHDGSFHCPIHGTSVDDLALHTTIDGDWVDGGERIEATFDTVGTCGGVCGPIDANLRVERCHGSGTLTLDRKIDPIVKAPGRHRACEDLVSEDLGDLVTAYFFNNTDSDLTLVRYDGTGAVNRTLSMQYGQAATVPARIGNVVELDWSTGCAYRFKVTEADQIEVFDGIQN